MIKEMLSIIKNLIIVIVISFSCMINICFADNSNDCNQLKNYNFYPANIIIKVNNNDRVHNLTDIYSKYLNQKMTCEELNNLTDKIREYFINQDYLRPIILTSIKNKTNILEIQVNLLNISDIIIVNSELTTNLIEDYAKKILSQKPAKLKYTLKYLGLMNKIPGYNVKQELKFDKLTKKLFLVITLSKQNGKVTASIDNYNLHSVGKIDQTVGVESYSPFGNNDFYSVQVGTTNHPDRFYNIMAGYSRPINSYGSFVAIIGSRTISNVTMHDPIPTKSGTDLRFSNTIGHYLLLDSTQSLIAAINYSIFSSKIYEVDLNNVAIPSLYTQFYSAGTGFRYTYTDSFNGTSTISSSYKKGIGGLYDDYTGNSTPYRLNYNLTNFSASRNQKLTDNISLISNMTATNITKYAPGAVSPSLGGGEYGRGYSPGTLIGNNLLAASFELGYNKEIKNNFAVANLNFYSFYDIGYIGVKDSTSNITKLSSIGTGIRMKLMYDVALNSEIAIPLRTNYIISDLDYTAPVRATFLVSKSFNY